MEVWYFIVAFVWLLLMWLRRRRFRRQQTLTAMDGQARSMGGRGGF